MPNMMEGALAHRAMKRAAPLDRHARDRDVLANIATPGRVVIALLQALDQWSERSRQRRALAKLDERLLKDIGVSRYDAEMEIAKPFWR